ncbi:hypothetical protein CLIM01_15031 [Colletotrichum limetticola]|uniref:Uncharacterized protein n=2 Tax=Colletotrichum acutatum species complex TaxID=2707335 RepID=A0ABQ9P6W6_9PEZI|nr:hypothetical protein CLIM01_15031 [Colletotrichum limetticola]
MTTRKDKRDDLSRLLVEFVGDSDIESHLAADSHNMVGSHGEPSNQFLDSRNLLTSPGRSPSAMAPRPPPGAGLMLADLADPKRYSALLSEPNSTQKRAGVVSG